MLTITALRVPATVTATDTGAGVKKPPVTGDGYVVLNSSAMPGADNTSNVKIQHSNDNGATDPWTDTGVTFAQVTNAGPVLQSEFISLDQFKLYVRAVNTIAGTTPSVTYDVTLIGRKH